MFKLISRLLAPAALGAMLALPVSAQNLFAPVVKVNDSVVTEFEIGQRQRFLRLLNAPGSSREEVVEGLISERLRFEAIREAGLVLSPDAANAALDEFAGRANLSRPEFIKALAQAGVAEETYRDFVLNGTAWRDLIRARFSNRVQISEADIDRAIAAQGTNGASNVQVLVSEIIIPAPPPRAAQVNALAEEISKTRSISQFSAFARRYSATATKDAGGRLPWQSISKLPPVLQPIILGLAPGEVSAPLNIPNAVALFQLRDIREVGRPEPGFTAIEYAAYYIPGGRSAAALQEAARIKTQVDVCDDLYGIAKGQPEETLLRTTQKPGEIPRDFAIELAKLDDGEVSTALTRSEGQSLVFLMMCGRTAASEAEIDREQIANSLRQRRFSGYADSLLAQLRADARIIRK